MKIPKELLPEDWDQTTLGDLICPCGDVIELDGECGKGHVSPLITMGLI